MPRRSKMSPRRAGISICRTYWSCAIPRSLSCSRTWRLDRAARRPPRAGAGRARPSPAPAARSPAGQLAPVGRPRALDPGRAITAWDRAIGHAARRPSAAWRARRARAARAATAVDHRAAPGGTPCPAARAPRAPAAPGALSVASSSLSRSFSRVERAALRLQRGQPVAHVHHQHAAGDVEDAHRREQREEHHRGQQLHQHPAERDPATSPTWPGSSDLLHRPQVRAARAGVGAPPLRPRRRRPSWSASGEVCPARRRRRPGSPAGRCTAPQRAEGLLHLAVLERVEGDDRRAAAHLEQPWAARPGARPAPPARRSPPCAAPGRSGWPRGCGRATPCAAPRASPTSTASSVRLWAARCLSSRAMGRAKGSSPSSRRTLRQLALVGQPAISSAAVGPVRPMRMSSGPSVMEGEARARPRRAAGELHAQVHQHAVHREQPRRPSSAPARAKLPSQGPEAVASRAEPRAGRGERHRVAVHADDRRAPAARSASAWPPPPSVHRRCAFPARLRAAPPPRRGGRSGGRTPKDPGASVQPGVAGA